MARPAENVEQPRNHERLVGQRAAAILFSYFPSDPRPWRAAKALAEAGMVVEVLCLQDDPATPLREMVQGISVFRVPLQKRRSGKIRYLFEYAGFLFAATAFLAWRSIRHGYRLVHVHNMPDFLVFAALVPRLLGTKVILDMHDPMPELYESINGHAPVGWLVRLLKRIEKLSIGFADLVLTPNVAFQELFVSRSCEPAKLHVIMNSPEEEIFHRNSLSRRRALARDPQEPFKLMYHGSFIERNGLDIAVEAVALARSQIPNITLDLCGKRTGYLDATFALAKRKGIEDCIRYVGHKSREDIARHIANSDLGLVPNRSSIFTGMNLPTRIFEYLAMGKPVIAPDTRGIGDYFGPGELLLFELGDPADLARAIGWCFHHPEEVDRFVERGRKIYQQHLWSSEKARFLSLIRSLMTRECRAAPLPSPGARV